MFVPRVDMLRQEKQILNEVLPKISEVISSGNYILSDNVKSFEREIADYIGVKYSLGVASGTDALFLSLCALGVSSRDEVITTPFTMAANVEAILRVGAHPVFVDINKDDFNINADLISAVITDKTKAILPVHLFGQSVDISFIKEIALQNDLFLIEDCCQAMGAEYDHKKLGSFGNINAMSFFPTKNLGCYGDGGAIFTDDLVLYEKIKKLRVHGQTKKYTYEYLGVNSRLDELQAAILRVKLNYLDKWNSERLKLAKRYNDLFSDTDSVICPIIKSKRKHVFHLYTVKVPNNLKLQNYLKQNKIESTINFPEPLYNQKAFNLTYNKNDFPNTNLLCQQALSIPLFVGLSEEEQDYVVKKIKEFF